MKKSLVFVLGILMFFVVVCFGRTISAEDEVLAKVGNEVITRIDFETRLKSLPLAVQEEMKNAEKKKELLDKMVKARLFVVEGGNRGLTERPDIKATIRMIRDDFITQEYVRAYLGKKVEVTDEEAEKEYNNSPEIREREYLKGSQIVVEKEEEAKEILEKLKKGENFKKLAKERSIHPEGKYTAGELEWFEKGKGEKEIEGALLKLEKGGVSDIVKANGRYYILKLDEKRIVPKPPFLKIKEEIVKKLTHKKITELVEKEIEELKKKITAEVFYGKLTEGK
jgi:peptidyl-prolyl cis-trans isomerase C